MDDVLTQRSHGMSYNGLGVCPVFYKKKIEVFDPKERGASTAPSISSKERPQVDKEYFSCIRSLLANISRTSISKHTTSCARTQPASQHSSRNWVHYIRRNDHQAKCAAPSAQAREHRPQERDLWVSKHHSRPLSLKAALERCDRSALSNLVLSVLRYYCRSSETGLESTIAHDKPLDSHVVPPWALLFPRREELVAICCGKR